MPGTFSLGRGVLGVLGGSLLAERVRKLATEPLDRPNKITLAT